jgi:polysaccharide chain length determinant protein (PEP-CTERM system associated)
MKEQVESLFVLLRSAARFRWPALGVALGLMLFGTVAVLCLPDRYESRAQIFVDSRSILRPLLQGLAVAPATQDQADMVRRALLARPSIDKVARSTGIIARAETPAAREALITSLADQIMIKGESSLGLYTISYPDSDPKMALSVVDTLLKAFVQNSVGEGREDAHSAEQFLERQVADYGKRLFDSEQRLADFKKKNVGLMPDQRGDYFGRMQTERAALDKLRTDLNVARRQREALLGKLRGDSSAALVATALPTATEIQAATTLDTRIRESRRHLDELLLKYTEKHPEVLAVTDTIKRLEEQRRTELGGIRATNSGEPSASGATGGDPVMQSLQIGLNGADVQIASLEAQVTDAQGRVGQLERLVTTGPEVEAELVRLNRDYGVTKTQYEALLQRLETARLALPSGLPSCWR